MGYSISGMINVLILLVYGMPCRRALLMCLSCLFIPLIIFVSLYLLILNHIKYNFDKSSHQVAGFLMFHAI